ncbi:glycosyltransferase [Sandarakinorhabdus sp.]|uniref:glycosyltransferase family 2 protein n=1 Tax=Sandarakinorhabdus sp. TaxID=1916663 RepID=UPI003340351C
MTCPPDAAGRADGNTASDTGVLTGPVITVVIPHLNTPDSLCRCLASVTTQELAAGAFEVIVVDNGSREPIDALVAARFPGVRVLVDRTPGPGPARNTGAQAARADLLAFTDADCIAQPGWLANAHAGAAAGQIVGGRVAVDVADPQRLTGIEAFESVLGFRQAYYIARKYFSVTANLAMPREMLRAVGPFGGIAIAEDVDWGQRAHAMGKVLTYQPAMLVLHPPRADFASLARKFDRMTNHFWEEHHSSGRPLWRWWLLVAIMVASPAIDMRHILLSPLISGMMNRYRGLRVLFAIRWYRARAMLAAASGTARPTAWNR